MSGEDVTGLALKAFSFTKNLYKQGKNAVLNVGDIEAKTKEATNRKFLLPPFPPNWSQIRKTRRPRSPELTAGGGGSPTFVRIHLASSTLGVPLVLVIGRLKSRWVDGHISAKFLKIARGVPRVSHGVCQELAAA